MEQLTLRAIKQEELTHAELDANFTYLKNMIEDLEARVEELENGENSGAMSFDGWSITDDYGYALYAVDGTTIKDARGYVFGVIDVENMQVNDDYGNKMYTINETIGDMGSTYDLRDDYGGIHYLLVSPAPQM